MPQIVNIFFVMYLLAVFPQFLKADDTPWPIPDWQNSKDKSLLESTQCLNFKNFSTENPEFKTDSLLVIKNGLINYEFYDSETNANKPHVLWSITKTITGLLLGIAQRDGRINLDQLLHEYLPNATKDMNYNKITINNLLYLDPGFIWEESMKDVLLNPVVNML
ncbi:MAG: serine hydrolase, partial [Bacteriovorax sp.]|nr:serine hydrolase [Bacteriovorax sp.]